MLTHIGTLINKIYKIQRYDYSQMYDVMDFVKFCREYAASYGESFVIDKDNSEVVRQLALWAIGNPKYQGATDKGIYLAGNTGTGKSWMMNILHCYCKSRQMAIGLPDVGYKPMFIHTYLAGDISDMYAKNGNIEYVKRLPILCVQDLGSEPAERQYMGNRLDVMRHLIEYRGEYKDKITLFSSNLPLDRVRERYGDRAASRLADMCTYITLTGCDRRRK